MTEAKSPAFDPNVDFEFTQSFNSPYFGPVWAGKRVVIRKSKADLYVKEGKGFIVDAAAEADAHKKQHGRPGADKLAGAGDVELKGAPATSGDPADKDGTSRAGQGDGAAAAEGAAEPEDLNKNTVPELKALAEKEGIDLEGATLKADIVAAIELAREAKKAE